MNADRTLDDFLKVMNDPGPTYHSVDHLMSNVFCPDDPSARTPSVGITDYGPQYRGVADVRELFERLFSTFPNLALTPVEDVPRLYSRNGRDTIAVEVTVTGSHDGEWFERTHKFYSPPLSDIAPSGKAMNIAGCCVFTFNERGQIVKWAIYMDRYKLPLQLALKPADLIERDLPLQ